jgi:hypothetical protein
VEHVASPKWGQAFHFGLMSGVLEGYVKDLHLVGGDMSSFEIDAATVPTRGVPHFSTARRSSRSAAFWRTVGALEETFFFAVQVRRTSGSGAARGPHFPLRASTTAARKSNLLRARCISSLRSISSMRVPMCPMTGRPS